MSPEFSWIIVTLDTMEAKKTEQENCMNKSRDLKAASFSTTFRKHAIILLVKNITQMRFTKKLNKNIFMITISIMFVTFPKNGKKNRIMIKEK
jgi:hypothetical protein